MLLKIDSTHCGICKCGFAAALFLTISLPISYLAISFSSASTSIFPNPTPEHPREPKIHPLFIPQQPAPVPDQKSPDPTRSCDLFRGRWVPDPARPFYYTNSSCPIITQTQNCEANGRPDRGYLFWRWAPEDCPIPRFDPALFLHILRGKFLAFVGDSLTRNHMESLVCMLMQEETPVNRGNKRIHKWFFPRSSVTIARIWSSWLVDQSPNSFPGVPADAAKLDLQKVDPTLAYHLPKIDILVISSGHWFTKKAAFILNNRVAGTIGFPLSSTLNPSPGAALDNVAAFSIALNTALRFLATVPGYSGLTLLRTFSPDHYETGAWNTGGSCVRFTQPLREEELLENRFTSSMRGVQLEVFREVINSTTTSNGSKLRLMDIEPLSAARADGHPGPYRSPLKPLDSARKNSPQDCLHWCMPGPIDTWNELLLEILKQEFSTLIS